MEDNQKYERLKEYAVLLEKITYMNTKIKIQQNGIASNSLRTRIDERNEVIKRMVEIENAIDALPNREYRFVLGYLFLQTLTIEEIANLMNCSPYKIAQLQKEAIAYVSFGHDCVNDF